MTYVPAAFRLSAFNCVICDAYAKQQWIVLEYHNGSYREINSAWISICSHCDKKSYWIEKSLVHPDIILVPPPNEDLGDDIKNDYIEAGSILSRSPKGASALLRLAIQKLCIQLGGSGKNINDDIAKLVKNGLPIKVQKALDIVRVVGNNAVHPGVIDLEDNDQLALSLFNLINIIADVMITQPKHVNELYDELPANLIGAIERRDNNLNS